MKQFSLEEYLKNPSKKVVTRDGRSARIRCTDRIDPYFPIVALISTESGEDIVAYTSNGLHWLGAKTDYDLFFAPEKHEGWINLFRGSLCELHIGDFRIFESKEDAEKNGKNKRDYAKSVKIEWEE